MAKKLKNLKWQNVALEGFPASVTGNLQGFVGLEECKTYRFEREVKKPKKKKLEKKRQNTESRSNLQKEDQVPTKKVKLSNGFTVEICDTHITPSQSNENPGSSNKQQNKTKQNKTSKNPTPLESTPKKEVKKNKVKLGEERSDVVTNLTPEDMLTWAEFKLPEPILRALTEMGFKQPTKIQQMTLPAAIHGRRDILGAAETGSGKTLAFGLPILTGILKLKEKAELKGLDVYDIPYKKTSKKKKNTTEAVIKNKNDKNKRNVNNKKGRKDVATNHKKVNKDLESTKKESSEDGYETGDESSNSETEDNTEKRITDKKTQNNKNVPQKRKFQAKNKQKSKTAKDEDFLEEIEVPLRKKSQSTDEIDSDGDSDENYVHLSDMLDSDDLVDSSSEDEYDHETEAKDNESTSDGDTTSVNNEEEIEEEGNEDSEGNDEDIDENERGIGCVKVIDNIEIPGHVSTKTGKPLYALILTPTRELAIQVSRHLIAAAKYTGIRVATIVGGMAAVKQERVLRCGPEVVVATPGRLWELVSQGQPHLQQLDSVKFLAIDETDRMVERGHFEELHPLLERLNVDGDKQASRQNFVFSATLTMVHDLPTHLRGQKVTKHGKILKRKIEKMTPEQKVKRLVNMIGMSDPKVVDITTQNLGTAETLTESRIACAFDHKDAYLYYVLKRHPGRTIVFCNSVGCVRRLAQLFTILKCHPLPLHASMPQRQRLKNLERFRDDPRGVLVSTDVAARGLDIPNVDHVIHYQVPRTAENYVHRSGRTARASKEGLTILMMEPAEAFLYSKLCRTLNRTSEVPSFPVSAHALAPLKDLVALARDIDALELKKRRTSQALGWREKVAKEMDMIVDDDDVPATKADPSLEKALRAKRRQLTAMLSRPLFPQGFSFKYPTLNDPMALVDCGDNALQVMKKAIQSGELKKQKRKGKNSEILKLEKVFKKTQVGK